MVYSVGRGQEREGAVNALTNADIMGMKRGRGDWYTLALLRIRASFDWSTIFECVKPRVRQGRYGCPSKITRPLKSRDVVRWRHDDRIQDQAGHAAKTITTRFKKFFYSHAVSNTSTFMPWSGRDCLKVYVVAFFFFWRIFVIWNTETMPPSNRKPVKSSTRRCCGCISDLRHSCISDLRHSYIPMQVTNTENGQFWVLCALNGRSAFANHISQSQLLYCGIYIYAQTFVPRRIYDFKRHTGQYLWLEHYNNTLSWLETTADEPRNFYHANRMGLECLINTISPRQVSETLENFENSG